jgi:heme-degrading monooxygenase HmoA
MAMEMVITRIAVNPGAEAEWEAVMRDRMAAAEAAEGWIAGYVVAPDDDGSARVIVGLWRSRADWEAWHDDDAFADTGKRLDGLERDPGAATWHGVVFSATAGGAEAAP